MFESPLLGYTATDKWSVYAQEKETEIVTECLLLRAGRPTTIDMATWTL